MLGRSLDGEFMRILPALLLVASFCALPLMMGADRAAAIFSCGMFDGKFTCKATTGGVSHGKNATPGERETPDSVQEAVQPGEHACPPGFKVLDTPNASGSYCEPPAGEPETTNAGCEHGMVGTPPSCHCPQNSELLGGNCVHYKATCSNGLAADFNPQPCAGVDEKLACKMRQDGLKDCCCLTYDKL
jgi:hypothetical protein